jgi:hypothetical protein
MRSHPLDSPQAAGRVLAIMLIADGHVCTSELGLLQRLGAERRLGLPEGGLGVVLRELCEDLLAAGHHAGSLLERLDGHAMRSVMKEVADPRLRREVLALAQAAARSDGHLADGEAFVLGAACRYWSVSPASLAQPALAH